METLKFKIKGIVPLLMHNGQMKNPLNLYVKKLKEISGKRKKTDSDFLEMSNIEFEAGLYFDKDGNIYIPDIMLESAIINGAKEDKLGKTFKAAISVASHMYLKNGKQYTKDQVLGNENYRFITDVKIGQSSVMRTRPRFDEWNGEFEVHYNNELVNKSNVINAVTKCGRQVGIGDWRPRFGRFEVVEVK
jgi:hypothetical protein